MGSQKGHFPIAGKASVDYTRLGSPNAAFSGHPLMPITLLLTSRALVRKPSHSPNIPRVSCKSTFSPNTCRVYSLFRSSNVRLINLGRDGPCPTLSARWGLIENAGWTRTRAKMGCKKIGEFLGVLIFEVQRLVPLESPWKIKVDFVRVNSSSTRCIAFCTGIFSSLISLVIY